MASCYDCIHCGACSDAGDSGFSSLKEDVSGCKHFKNKVDVVEVVRCKDCKHRETFKCPMFSFEYQEWTDDYQTTDLTEDNGFCQYGEKKQG